MEMKAIWLLVAIFSSNSPNRINKHFITLKCQFPELFDFSEFIVVFFAHLINLQPVFIYRNDFPFVVGRATPVIDSYYQD